MIKKKEKSGHPDLGQERKEPKSSNPKRILIILFWTILIGSIIFAVYTHLTVVDTRTYIEREIVETHIVDTSGIESFLLNFAQVYHTWPADREGQAARHDRLQEFMTDRLRQLNADMVRTDTNSSATMHMLQIWNIDQVNDYTFDVRYSIQQLVQVKTITLVDEVLQEQVDGGYYDGYITVETVVQHEVEDIAEHWVQSFFTTTIHRSADDGSMVITRSPTITTAPERSTYVPPLMVDGVDRETRAVLLEFLQGFFALYPTATESTMQSFVRNNAMIPLNKEHTFIDITESAFIPDGDHIIAHVIIQFYDPRTFSHVFAQYDLVLAYEGSWVIIQNLNDREVCTQ